MPVWDTLEAVGEGLNAARDLVAADPNTLNPVENLAREGLRAYCRSQEWIDGNIPLGASVGGAYVCDPLWNEPGNSPPDGSCVTFIDIVGDAFAGGSDCSNRFDRSRTVEWAGTHTGVTISRGCGGPGGVCGDEFGYSFTDDQGNTSDCRDPTVGFFSNLAIADTRVVCDLPEIGDPYPTGDPISTPYGPVNVEPKPWGPRIFPPIGPPIDIPFDPLEPIPDPTSRDRPEDGPVTPADDPAPAPDDDGVVDFGDPPDGFVFVGLAWEVTMGVSVLGEILGTGADIISPSILGNVRLRVRNGSLTVSTPFFRVNTETGYIIRECSGLEVIGANVNSIDGVEITITPLLAEVVDDSEE
jgi:hypothetical protein